MEFFESFYVDIIVGKWYLYAYYANMLRYLMISNVTVSIFFFLIRMVVDMHYDFLDNFKNKIHTLISKILFSSLISVKQNFDVGAYNKKKATHCKVQAHRTHISVF